jgi:mono/diheme cytochrome c family protein
MIVRSAIIALMWFSIISCAPTGDGKQLGRKNTDAVGAINNTDDLVEKRALGDRVTYASKSSPSEFLPGSEESPISENSPGAKGPQITGNDEKKNLAKAVLDKHCLVCHNSGKALGNFGMLDNLPSLAREARYVIPGDAANSLLLKVMVAGGTMPPSGLLNKTDVDLVADWISNIPKEVIPIVESKDLISQVKSDATANVASTDRSSTRYFSFHSVPAGDQTPSNLKIYQLALTKALNSISNVANIVQPVKVDKNGLLFKINLIDIGVTPARFDRFVRDFYPFGFAPDQNSTDPTVTAIRTMMNETFQLLASSVPVVRGDWFVATFALPLPYEQIMALGQSRLDLDRKLGLDLNANIRQGKVMRAAFKNSGVSQHNRMIERHTQPNGMSYWISYDFADSQNQQNIFTNPLGPAGLSQNKSFAHDGGEIIWQLPNGLLGFYLAAANGNAIHKGPLQIVSQPTGGQTQFLSAIVNGISCMSCHDIGIINKRDEVRDYTSNVIANSFSTTEQELIKRLYSPTSDLDQKIAQDNVLYVKAVKELGLEERRNANLPDVINVVYGLYNRNLSRSVVARELAISDEELSKLMDIEPFKSDWSALTRSDGYIKRDEFNTLYARAVNQRRSGVNAVRPQQDDYVVTPNCMAVNATDMTACLNNIQ